MVVQTEPKLSFDILGSRGFNDPKNMWPIGAVLVLAGGRSNHPTVEYVMCCVQLWVWRQTMSAQERVRWTKRAILANDFKSTTNHHRIYSAWKDDRQRSTEIMHGWFYTYSKSVVSRNKNKKNNVILTFNSAGGTFLGLCQRCLNIRMGLRISLLRSSLTVYSLLFPFPGVFNLTETKSITRLTLWFFGWSPIACWVLYALNA